MTDEILTLKEVAEYLGVHEMTVYKLIKSSKIPAIKLGGQWRFKRDVLDHWLESEMIKKNDNLKNVG